MVLPLFLQLVHNCLELRHLLLHNRLLLILPAALREELVADGDVFLASCYGGTAELCLLDFRQVGYEVLFKLRDEVVELPLCNRTSFKQGSGLQQLFCLFSKRLRLAKRFLDHPLLFFAGLFGCFRSFLRSLLLLLHALELLVQRPHLRKLCVSGPLHRQLVNLHRAC